MSQLTDAKTRLADQEPEIKNADSKLQLSLSEAEKLKTSLDAKKKSWADEKALLIQHAETAEAALKEATMEVDRASAGSLSMRRAHLSATRLDWTKRGSAGVAGARGRHGPTRGEDTSSFQLTVFTNCRYCNARP